MTKNRGSNRMFVVRLLTALLVVVSSQVVVAQKYTLGIRAGGSITWPGFGDPESKDVFNRRMKPGVQGGILIGFPLRDNYDLILEGGMSQRGRILTFNQGHEWQNSTTYRMVDMGMMLKRSFTFMLKKDTPTDAFINIGPQINYWMSSVGYIRVGDGPKYRYDMIFGDGEYSGDDYAMRVQDVNRWLFSLGIGAGFKMPLREGKHLVTEVRFISGHTFLGKETSSYQGMNGILWGDGNMQDTMKTNLKTINLTVAYTLDVDVKESRRGKSTINKRMKKAK